MVASTGVSFPLPLSQAISLKVCFVSSDRSSYSDSGLLYIQQQRPLFEILSISANIFMQIDNKLIFMQIDNK